MDWRAFFTDPLVLACIVLVLLPPRFDPAIRIKEWQITQGWHPESPRKRDGHR